MGPPDSDPSGDNIFVYIGPPPNYTGCPPVVWSNTGNLLSPVSLVDATQTGGAFYEPWAITQTRLAGAIVSSIVVVTDTSGGANTTIVDNTNVNGTIYPYEEASFFVDHFACYDVRELTRLQPQSRTVTLDDQFGTREDARIRGARTLCAPVDKNGEGIIFEDFHLVCYDVATPERPNVDVRVENQFGAQNLRVDQRRVLCVPSSKTVLGGPPPDDDDDDDDNDDDDDDNGNNDDDDDD